MKMKTRTEITVELHRRWVVRQSRQPETWCHRCLTPVQMISAESAAVLAGVSTRTIYRWAEGERLHFCETLEGSLLVCPSSLPGQHQPKEN